MCEDLTHRGMKTMGPQRRITLFLDGTWNTVNDNTNVWRLKALSTNDTSQLCYYSAGVGTQRGERIRGGMFGYGLDQEVVQAYEWLTENYQPEDKIFIFGFSRGAFTARSLAGLISKCGLLKAGSPISLTQLYERYRKGGAVHSIRELHNQAVGTHTQEDMWLIKYSQAVPLWFQGVWDTVGALGVPFGHIPVLSRSNYGYLETDLRINDTHAFHALAIDEHRKAFEPTLWKRTVSVGAQAYPARPLVQVEQRWFVGAHADVGGGYANGLLAQQPLRWLMQKAQMYGLTVKASVDIDDDANGGVIHDSFAEMAGGLYRACRLGRRYIRPIGTPTVTNDGHETSTINESIDSSVFARWRADSKYRPPNLVEWSSRYRIDMSAIDPGHSVRADNPATIIPDAVST